MTRTGMWVDDKYGGAFVSYYDQRDYHYAVYAIADALRALGRHIERFGSNDRKEGSSNE